MDSEQAKFLADQLTRMWEGEFPVTCKVLAAVPDEKRDYRPDPKSRTAWELATHLATADIWFLDCVLNGSFVYDAEAAQQAESQFTTVADVVAFYEKTFPAKVAAVRAMPAGKLAEVVDFFGMMQQPNASFIGFGNNHSVHHRGQLASYLRAMGSKVPAIYGGSADEPMHG